MLNEVKLIGNLVADPETRYTASGSAIANVRIATSRKWRDKQSGEMKEESEFHRVVFFGKLAEIVGKYLVKGRQVYVSGRLKTSKYQGQDGQDRYSTDIIADDMKMLGNKGQQQSAPQPQNQPQQSQQAAPVDDYSDMGDIPFMRLQHELLR